MERSRRVEVLDSEVPPRAVQEPIPCAALGVRPRQGNLGEGLVLSCAAGRGEVCIVPAREGLETGLELPTAVSSCPRDASNLSGALGSGGQWGPWGRQLWEDGHHFRCGSAGWLQVVATALQDMRYQHLLSLYSVQLDAAVLKEF